MQDNRSRAAPFKPFENGPITFGGEMLIERRSETAWPISDQMLAVHDGRVDADELSRHFGRQYRHIARHGQDASISIRIGMVQRPIETSERTKIGCGSIIDAHEARHDPSADDHRRDMRSHAFDRMLDQPPPPEQGIGLVSTEPS